MPTPAPFPPLGAGRNVAEETIANITGGILPIGIATVLDPPSLDEKVRPSITLLES